MTKKRITGAENLLDQGYTPRDLAKMSAEYQVPTGGSGFTEDLDPRVGEFNLDSEYDAGIQAGMDQQLYRAENQPGSTQAFNAVVGGIGMGLLTAVEDLSYLADFDNHIKAAQGLDTNERNWLAEAMVEGKEGIKEAMPIHRKTNETFDWSDPGFYWESLRGVLDSAVGFGLPGGIVAKGVGLGMRASRASAYLRLATKSRQAAPVAQALISGGIQNYAEGKIMALETFEETMKSFEPLIAEGKMTEKEAKSLAGEAADDMLMHNRAMILTDAFSLYGLIKGLDATRNVLKQKGFTNRIKDFGKNVITPNADNLILQGAKEAGEEITQNVIQMEAQYQAKKKAGQVDENIPEGTLDRLLHFAKSDQALLEGMMGFFGGGPQRILSEITSGNLSKSAREAYEKRYNEQQSLIAASSEFIQGHIKNQSERFKKRDELLSEGKYEEAMLEEKGAMYSEIMKHAAAGTLGEFENKIQTMIAEKGSEIGTEGTQKLQETLTDLKKIEKAWIKDSDRANVQEIVENRSNILLSEAALKHLTDKETKQQSELLKTIERRTAQYKNTFKYGEKGLFGLWTKTPDGESSFSFDLNNLTKNPYVGTDQVAAKNQYNKFVGMIRKTPEYQEWMQTKKEIKDTQDKIAAFEEEYDYLRTKKAEQEYKIAEFERIINRAAESKFREETQEANVSTIEPGGFYKDKNGGVYAIDNHPSDNSKVLVKKFGAKAADVMKKSDLDNKFLTDRGYIKFTDKETAEKAAKEAEKTADNIRKSQDPVTPKEKIVAASRVNYADTAEDLEPSNEAQTSDKTTEDAITGDNSSKNPLSAAWLSTNNERYSTPDNEEQAKLDNDITAFLEDKDNNLEGTTVEFEITKDSKNEDDIEISAFILDENGNRVTYNGSVIQLFVHAPKFGSEKRMGKYAETYKEDIRVLRRAILNGLKKGVVTTTIAEKRGGTLQTDDQLKSVTEVTGQEAKDVELVFQNKTGTLDKVKNPKAKGRTKNLTNSKKLGPSVNNDRAVGAIYTPVRMANGKYMPMRLTVDNLTSEEADIVIDIYLAMFTNSVNPKTQLKDAPDLLSNIEGNSPRVAKLLDVIVKSNLNGIEGFKKENITVSEILNWLVHEGEKATGKNKFPLYMKKGNIFFGEKGKQVTNAKDILDNRAELKEYLTTKKIRNINYRALNLPVYKEYLFETDADGRAILSSNAKISNTSEGPMFAQPTIILEDIDSSQSHRTDNAASIRRQIDANQGPAEKTTVDKTVNNPTVKFDFKENTPTEQAEDELGLGAPVGTDYNETEENQNKETESKIKEIRVAQGEVEDMEEDIYESFGEDIMAMAEGRFGTFSKFFNDYLGGQGKSLSNATEADLNAAARRYKDEINKCISS